MARCDTNSDDEDEIKKQCYVLDQDKVVFRGEVTAESMALLIRVLYKVVRALPLSVAEGQKPRLYLILSTSGGTLYDALGAYDHMCKLRTHVDLVTVAEGFVASAGTVLLMAGVQRLAMRNTGLLFHQLSSGVSGKYADMRDEVASCKWLMKKMCRLYTNNSNLTKEEVMTLLGREKTLSARKCIEMGFVTGYY
jgi:ATP-dependent protease ClpP protease subunit